MQSNKTIDDYVLISSTKLADLLGITKAALWQNLHRHPADFPPMHKTSKAKNATIRFKKQEVMTWIDNNQHFIE